MKIALVSYINTTPFTDGLKEEFDEEEIELNFLTPSACAEALRRGDCDLALIPVGALPDFNQVSLLPNWCIGANGPVRSVFLFSHTPIEQISEIYADPDSRTSNLLCRLLLKHHWQKDIILKKSKDRNIQKIEGKTAAVVIGDLAIKVRHQFEYAYDLAEEWHFFCGLPFVFAVWASGDNALSSEEESRLDRAFQIGTKQAAQSARKWAKHFDIDEEFALQYLTHDIDFRFDAPKHRAFSSFWLLAFGC